MSKNYSRKTLQNQLGSSKPVLQKKIEHEAEKNASDLIKIAYRHFFNGCYLSALYCFQVPELKFNAEAQFWQGFMYRYGKEGIPINPPLALECFLNSVPEYTSNACNQIGLAFENGFGVPVNLQKALEWYYKGNECSFNTVKLIEQGLTLSKEEKEKPIEVLIKETSTVLKKDDSKLQLSENQQNNQIKDEYTYQEFTSVFT